jgi:hypothetical protein
MDTMAAPIRGSRSAAARPGFDVPGSSVPELGTDVISVGSTAGRKVQIRRPRVRAGKAEVPLPSFEAMAHTGPLNRRIVEQMLLGVAVGQRAIGDVA